MKRVRLFVRRARVGLGVIGLETRGSWDHGFQPIPGIALMLLVRKSEMAGLFMAVYGCLWRFMNQHQTLVVVRMVTACC